jgi:hypothetical protein
VEWNSVYEFDGVVAVGGETVIWTRRSAPAEGGNCDNGTGAGVFSIITAVVGSMLYEHLLTCISVM